MKKSLLCEGEGRKGGKQPLTSSPQPSSATTRATNKRGGEKRYTSGLKEWWAGGGLGIDRNIAKRNWFLKGGKAQ